jgi:hypothetical protein
LAKPTDSHPFIVPCRRRAATCNVKQASFVCCALPAAADKSRTVVRLRNVIMELRKVGVVVLLCGGAGGGVCVCVWPCGLALFTSS